MLERMGRKKALLPLFNHLYDLQRSDRNGKGGVSKTALTMVEKYGASSDGKTGWAQAQETHHACKRKKDQERKVWQNIDRLAEFLLAVWPPAYPHSIHLKREENVCWLSNLQTSPAPQAANCWLCQIDGNQVQTGPIRLPFKPSRSVHPKFVIAGKWKPPKHFQDYEEFRSTRWKEYCEKYPTCHNSPSLFFSNIKLEDRALEIRIKSGVYADYVATVKSLERSLKLRDGSQKSVREVLEMGWNIDSNLLPRAVASPIALELIIVTAEDAIVVCKYKRVQKWSVSVSATPSPVLDGYHNDAIGMINRTIRRRTHEEMGLEVAPEQIAWMGFGVGRKIGHTGLIGQIKLKKANHEIRKCFANRREREEVEEIEFIPLEIDAVQRFLKTRDCGYFLRLGLHLSLWRKFPKRVSIQ